VFVRRDEEKGRECNGKQAQTDLRVEYENKILTIIIFPVLELVDLKDF
jgi:hypothetical protein